MLNRHFQDIVINATGATNIISSEVIQTLWSGYGEIVRINLAGANIKSVVLKYIIFPNERDHPRGWTSDFAHQRKVKSYDVEMNWYQDWSVLCDEKCRVAKNIALQKLDNERIILLEDLDASGFGSRFDALQLDEVKLCLEWLANFHAKFLDVNPKGLWKIGTYWHLQTRPDEFAALEEGKLKQNALKIDQLLNQCRYQTLVHGDAKVANFCFSPDRPLVAAVDFQYVGRGCGMKDVAYFIGSCLDEKYCEAWQEELLDYYFFQFNKALSVRKIKINWLELEQEWRTMYSIAWTDFFRFVSGWMPTHHKINSYSKRITAEVLRQLDNW